MKTDLIFSVARRAVATLALATALAILLPAPAAAAGQEPTTELLRVTNVSIESAHQLVRGVCGESGCTDIRYLERENMLSITAEPAVHERIRAMMADFDRPYATRTFQIIVLAADRGGDRAADVPANVNEALTDISEFLPYTGFRMLGSGLLRASASGSTTLPGPMNLRADLAFRPTTDPASALLIEHFRVTNVEPVDTVVDGVVTQQMRRNEIVEATFTIDPGQTVVVGVSKLNGDDSAVVVLLTAVQS